MSERQRSFIDAQRKFVSRPNAGTVADFVRKAVMAFLYDDITEGQMMDALKLAKRVKAEKDDPEYIAWEE